MAEQFDRWIEAELEQRLASFESAPTPTAPRYLAARSERREKPPSMPIRWRWPLTGTGLVALASAALLVGGTAAVAARILGVAPFGAPLGTVPTPIASSCPSPQPGQSGSSPISGSSTSHCPGPSTGGSPGVKKAGPGRSAAQPSNSPSGARGHSSGAAPTPGAGHSGSGHGTGASHGKASPPGHPTPHATPSSSARPGAQGKPTGTPGRSATHPSPSSSGHGSATAATQSAAPSGAPTHPPTHSASHWVQPHAGGSGRIAASDLGRLNGPVRVSAAGRNTAR